MKSIRWTIWILLAFVVVATLDSQPDPPAVNPGTVLCKIFQESGCACAPATQPCTALATSAPVLVSLVSREACQPQRPVERLILTVNAADPSPPALLAVRQVFQA